jgi:hypothetical protein
MPEGRGAAQLPECGRGAGRAVQGATGLRGGLQDEVDTDPAPRRGDDLGDNLGHAVGREAHNEQRPPRPPNDLDDDGAGEPDWDGVAGGAADGDVAPLGGCLSVDGLSAVQGKRHRGASLLRGLGSPGVDQPAGVSGDGVAAAGVDERGLDGATRSVCPAQDLRPCRDVAGG